MPSNTPECVGSRTKVNLKTVDANGYATCLVCGKARKVNDDGTIRKHDGWAKGPIKAELKAVPTEPVDEPAPVAVKVTPTKERLKPEHPPIKEIGFIVGVDQTDEDDLETATRRIKEYLMDGEHVKRVTFTHGKYYYEGKFYSSAEWKELTKDAEEQSSGS